MTTESTRQTKHLTTECGCYVGGIGNIGVGEQSAEKARLRMVYCPTHAEAPEMAGLLTTIADVLPTYPELRSHMMVKKAVADIRALLHRIDGGPDG